MELLKENSPILDLYKDIEKPEIFTLVDIGCSGGIDPVWLKLNKKLRCLGLDASVEEIKKLNSKNTHSGITYFDALLCLAPGHPFLEGGGNVFEREFEGRLSQTITLKTQEAKNKYTHDDKIYYNTWEKTYLSRNKISLLDALGKNNIADIDFLKIDIDGHDFEIIQDLDCRFNEYNILGIVMEVMYFGDESPHIHTFHNVDRFMRKNGYDLFGLTVRPGSVSALPSRYQWGIPRQTMFGRPFQGDALYIKDICADWNKNITLSPDKLINLLLIYSLFGLPDCAAEILFKFKSSLEKHLDIHSWLNKLTQQAMDLQNGMPEITADYQSYMKLFNSNDESFYYGVNGSRLRKQNEIVPPSLSKAVLYRKDEENLKNNLQYNRDTLPHIATPFFTSPLSEKGQELLVAIQFEKPCNSFTVVVQNALYEQLAVKTVKNISNAVHLAFNIYAACEELRLVFYPASGGPIDDFVPISLEAVTNGVTREFLRYIKTKAEMENTVESTEAEMENTIESTDVKFGTCFNYLTKITIKANALVAKGNTVLRKAKHFFKEIING